MSSHVSRIAERFASHAAPGNRASAPFFLAMAGFALKSAAAWLERAERDRSGIIGECTIGKVHGLTDLIEGMERSARRAEVRPPAVPEAIEASEREVV
jgi:hypothetical protein